MKFKFEKLKSYIQKKAGKMFNLYKHMQQAGNEGKEPKESETTGHDRFYQERPRTSYRKKKRRGACRRAQSAAELNPESIAAANKRNAFRIRSVSTDREESEGRHRVNTTIVLLEPETTGHGRFYQKQPRTSYITHFYNKYFHK